MDLVRDLLDVQLRDRRFRRFGRVDGLVLEMRDGAPPRLAFIESGGGRLARRLHPIVRAAYERLARWLGWRATPLRIPAQAIEKIDLTVTVDLDGAHDDVLRVERDLARHVGRGPKT